LGKYDLSLDISEPEADRRDVAKTVVHVNDAGPFALDTKADAMAALIGQFMKPEMGTIVWEALAGSRGSRG